MQHQAAAEAAELCMVLLPQLHAAKVEVCRTEVRVVQVVHQRGISIQVCKSGRSRPCAVPLGGVRFKGPAEHQRWHDVLSGQTYQ